MKVDVLAIGAHPDDVELSCSGTLLRHIDQGKTVGLLDLTRGELGTRGSADIRDREAANAMHLMGAAFRKNLQMPDGFFEYNRTNIVKIIEIIRWCQPEIVLANARSDRHPDHGKAAKLVADACFYAGLVKIETQYESEPLRERWRPKAVYHYIQDHNLKADFVVDISEYMERKIELVLAFRSQFYIPNDKEFEKELSSPISGKDFIEALRAKARNYGRIAGFEYAEGFNVARTPGIKDLFDLL
jgi:bacillithiol biosynthesis deacetylase BshB1